MVDPKNIDSAITLELSGGTTTSDDFRQVVTAFDGLLKAVTKSALPDGDAVKWMVRPKGGGILLGFDPVNLKKDDAKRIKRTLAQTLDGNVACEERQKIFNCIRRLSRRGNVHLWVGKKRTSITNELHSELRASLRTPYRLPGSVEGIITNLSERNGLTIQERIWGKRIKCSVPEDQLDRMRTLWRKRVMAEGVVHYGWDGYPTKIDAETVDPIPDDDELPSYMDVLGILKADWSGPTG